MVKIQKTDKNGKVCEFWELTEEDKAKMKAESEKRKAEWLKQKQEKASELLTEETRTSEQEVLAFYSSYAEKRQPSSEVAMNWHIF